MCYGGQHWHSLAHSFVRLPYGLDCITRHCCRRQHGLCCHVAAVCARALSMWMCGGGLEAQDASWYARQKGRDTPRRLLWSRLHPGRSPQMYPAQTGVVAAIWPNLARSAAEPQKHSRRLNWRGLRRTVCSPSPSHERAPARRGSGRPPLCVMCLPPRCKL